MRRNSSFSILFLAILLISPKIVSANDQTVKSVTINHSKEKKVNIPAESKTTDPAFPAVPVTKAEEHSKKPHILKTDELAHIHHFHKERVKKLKRHHKKYWVLSKLLLILSHIVLLICAYLHLTH